VDKLSAGVGIGQRGVRPTTAGEANKPLRFSKQKKKRYSKKTPRGIIRRRTG